MLFLLKLAQIMQLIEHFSSEKEKGRRKGKNYKTLLSSMQMIFW